MKQSLVSRNIALQITLTILLFSTLISLPVRSQPAFALGADVSWLTEMEAAGRFFYTREGQQKECMVLLKDLGMNSIRLRVWVNPTGVWNGLSDVLVKAKRANDLGMRLMIDFHYSDNWADPGKQTKPVESGIYILYYQTETATTDVYERQRWLF